MTEGDGVTRGPAEKPQPAIDATQLAALIDGRLSPSERAALLEQLDRSNDALDVLVDAAAASAEVSVDVNSTPAVVPLADAKGRRSGRWLLFAIAAAAVVVGAMVAPRARTWLRGSTPKPTEFLASLALPSGVVTMAMDSRPWSEARGGTAAEQRVLAIRVGATLADLEVARRSIGDSATRAAAVTRAMDDLIAVLDGAPAGSASAQAFRMIRSAPLQAPPEQLATARDAAISISPDYVTLGAWAEGARLAALAHDERFFTQPSTTAMLDRVAAHPELDADAREMLRRIRELLRPADPMGWTRLAATLRELLTHLGG
jgi:hypothetical protein